MTIALVTVNDEDEMRHCVAMGVEFITSDRPDRLRQVVGPRACVALPVTF